MPARFALGFISGGAALFEGGNQSFGSVLEMLEVMGASSNDDISPVAGGTLTINSQSLGSYDFRIIDGDVTLSSFAASDYFTNTQDSRSAILVIKGNLTINNGVTVIPAVRKLFTAIYVRGNLTINGGGAISMSQRGANHHTSGSSISAAAIRLATGTYGGVSNPQVPASGASGSTSAGGTGSDGQTGGGGGGGYGSGSRSGAAGTSFSGGSGGAMNRTPEPNGGRGGNGGDGGFDFYGGGAGNPGGSGGGGNGTGGVLLVVCAGTLSGSGSITSAGASGGGGGGTNGTGGGGSGGGSVTVLYGTDSSSITPSAPGGSGGGNGGRAGGPGTTRKLALAA